MTLVEVKNWVGQRWPTIVGGLVIAMAATALGIHLSTC